MKKDSLEGIIPVQNVSRGSPSNTLQLLTVM